MKKTIAITGDGSWATALAYVLSGNGHQVNWHIRTPEILESMKEKGFNGNYLRFLHFENNKPYVTSVPEDAIERSEIVLIVVPSAFIKSTFEDLSNGIFTGRKVISATKGLLPDLKVTPCDYLKSYKGINSNDLAFLSGPSHAEEVAEEMVTYLTMFSENINVARELASVFAGPSLKVSASEDLRGAEYATALKNVMALAVGICHGLGYGDNFTAVLVSSAIKEIRTFIDTYVNHKQRDIADYTYTGDLLVTCYSQHSRNRIFGNMIGRGYTVESARMEMNMIAEGYYAVKPIIEIASAFNIRMPICNSVYNILYKNGNARSEIHQLVVNLH